MKSADYVCSNPTHRLTDITSILVEVKTQAIPETMETKQNITSIGIFPMPHARIVVHLSVNTV